MADGVKKREQIRKLSKNVQSGIYDMLKLTSELLVDGEYLDQHGGYENVLDDLEKNDFSHFGDNPSLKSMLRAYEHNPLRTTWAEYRYNVKAMIALAEPKKEERPTERINWKSRAQEAEANLKAARSEIKRLKKSQAKTDAKLQRLIAETSELKGQIRATEKFAVMN